MNPTHTEQIVVQDRSTGGSRPDDGVAPPHNRTLSSDALAAMVGVGIPTALIVTCWLGALLLSGTYLTDLLTTAGVGHTTAVSLSIAAAVVFALAAWARLMAPDTARRLVDLLGWAVVVLWLIAVLASDAPLVLVVLVPAWSMVGTAAGVRLIVDRRRTTTHTLYRYYDRSGRLLYVGRTHQGQGRRAGQHAADKPWWPQVASREVTFLPTHSALVAAEREAIIRERPQHNIQHSTRRRVGKGRRR